MSNLSASEKIVTVVVVFLLIVGTVLSLLLGTVLTWGYSASQQETNESMILSNDSANDCLVILNNSASAEFVEALQNISMNQENEESEKMTQSVESRSLE